MLINAGIRRVYYAEGYSDTLAEEMAREAEMEFDHLLWEGD
jgi:deoxycytidylate deaminase